MTRKDVVIAGFGAAGAALALALVKGGMPAASIAVFDPASGGDAPERKDQRISDHRISDHRILALNAASRSFLESLSIWDALAETAYPMRSIALSDTAREEEIRPLLLGLEAAAGEALAHLMPLTRLQAVLREACRAAGLMPEPMAIRRFEADPGGVLLETGLKTALLVAADGASSPLRQQAGIPFHGWRYGQMALTAIIRHAAPHNGEAVQHFLPSGPFALLPLDEGRSSMVWSASPPEAKALLAADEAGQLHAISAAAAGWRGDILGIEGISAHPLALGLARRFVGDRLALVADAAHQVHPLAGQGLNLGFADVAALSGIILERVGLGLDCGAPDALALYQAQRRPPAVAMGYATEGLNHLFSNDIGPLRVIRDIGMGLVQRSERAKALFMRAASGLPRIAP